MKKHLIPLIGLLFMVGFSASTVLADWDKPCDHKKIVRWWWCDACKKISEFPDCKGAEYIWNFKDYRSGAGKYEESVKHQNLPLAWACEKIQFMCNNDKCERFRKCVPQPGVCEVCGEDFQSNAVLSRILFKCTGCGKELTEPGKGFTLIEGRYVETIATVGTCPDDGKPLDTICTLSGTCPHLTR